MIKRDHTFKLADVRISIELGLHEYVECFPQALALGEASVRRRRLRPAEAHGQRRLSGLRGRDHPSDDQKGFEVLPRRWVVERTFGWMTRWRRLVCDYEKRIDVSHAMILVAMGGNLIRRNAHP